MKPMNFPARKKARRIAALERLGGIANKETLTLMARVAVPNARAIRTKKKGFRGLRRRNG